jgi:hypothetical protein
MIFFFNIKIASKSISRLKINLALRKAEAIDNLPVPAPRSITILLFKSLNSIPAK